MEHGVRSAPRVHKHIREQTGGLLLRARRGGIDATKFGCLLLQFRAHPLLSHYAVYMGRFKIIASGCLMR